jgi:hypothetical protein
MGSFCFRKRTRAPSCRDDDPAVRTPFPTMVSVCRSPPDQLSVQVDLLSICFFFTKRRLATAVSIGPSDII